MITLFLLDKYMVYIRPWKTEALPRNERNYVLSFTCSIVIGNVQWSGIQNACLYSKEEATRIANALQEIFPTHLYCIEKV